METIKLWKIDDENISEIKSTKLDFENRLENWIVQDISVISNDYLFLGSQVVTDWGKRIDILAMDSEGNLIIIELKKDKTYREVTAQILDYASWVKRLTFEDINEIVLSNPENNLNLEQLYADRFPNYDIPSEFNSNHKMLIVGSDIDDSTRRIVQYLSETYNANINAVNFNYFKDNKGNEYLAKSFLISEEDTQDKGIGGKRSRSESILKTLFRLEKIKEGDKIVYYPAIESGIDKNHPLINPTIKNKSSKCLQVEGDTSYYSLSSLRRKIVKDLNLTGINPDWGFGMGQEWGLPTGEKLNDLLD